ncbi:MAG TPA: hypothetical protein PKM88_15345 [bacterium]|nr:hypothetical protein [bacterium]
MRGSDYPGLMAVMTGLGSGLSARLVAGCTWDETAVRAATGLAAGWLLTAGVVSTVRRTRRRQRRAADAAVDLAERPLTDAMATEAMQEATAQPELSAQDAAQLVSRMMRKP